MSSLVYGSRRDHYGCNPVSFHSHLAYSFRLAGDSYRADMHAAYAYWFNGLGWNEGRPAFIGCATYMGF